MPSCLGLFIQNNLIKYAKVSKEHEIKKIEAYGVKFFEKDVNTAIKQIVEETFSFNLPISVNISNEMYNYFDMFALLSKNDLQKAIKTEFDAYCDSQGFSSSVFETRSAVVPNIYDEKKLRVIHISDNKNELNKRMHLLSDYKLSTVSPISMAISSLQGFTEKQNALIVNIEDTTTITTIYDQKIYNVTSLAEGSKEILEKINLKENSFSKSYEVCKNTTIYTSEGRELQESEVTHLEDIMPTLYNIVGNIKKMLNEQTEKIDTVYITGTAALINNIDLYFQEYLEEARCEILKPDFVTNIKDINIKDYIEVNSAIAMALMGLEEGVSGMNFKKQSIVEKLPDWLKLETKKPNQNQKEKTKKTSKIKFDFGEKFDTAEKIMLRSSYTLLFVFIVYWIFSGMLSGQIVSKQQQADERLTYLTQQTSMANGDASKIQSKTSEYTRLIADLTKLSDVESDKLKAKNMIPNLLNQIMYIVPENVQITSIQNTTDRHIVIDAQSDKYEQLGYLKAKLKTEQIFNNVVSTAGEKDGGVVKVKIEGDLP